jgi:hypothetical protein
MVVDVFEAYSIFVFVVFMNIHVYIRIRARSIYQYKAAHICRDQVHGPSHEPRETPRETHTEAPRRVCLAGINNAHGQSHTIKLPLLAFPKRRLLGDSTGAVQSKNWSSSALPSRDDSRRVTSLAHPETSIYPAKNPACWQMASSSRI